MGGLDRMSVALWVVVGVVVGHFLCGLVPERWANRHSVWMRWFSWLVVTFGFLGAVGAAVCVMVFGPMRAVLLAIESAPIRVSIHFDSLAAIMMVLITFVGLVIVRYSDRYLLGEQAQGRFLRWIAFTLGAVLLLVVSGNLLLFTAAWVLTSLGLHKLLTHYDERPAARLAARKKFLISRIGDVMLVCALALTYRTFGSFEFSEVFAGAEQLADSAGGWITTLIGVLYVVGAMTKSAQFPVHSWLPDTMEAPTPVSALMHAGIINAGGFLILRLSPLIVLSPLALDLLAVVGAFTAIFASVVMLTQTSIKRSLAYSTIAQMGFMMLQCGLGAFTAALLHIVAHSLYKAHAFLSSGSGLDGGPDRFTVRPADRLSVSSASGLLIASVVLGVVMTTTAAYLFGLSDKVNSGGPVLVFILTVALVQLLWTGLKTCSFVVSLRTVFTAILACAGYFGAYFIFSHLLGSTVPHPTSSGLSFLILGLVALGFLFVFALQAMLTTGWQPTKFRWLYVHASNGFYVDIMARNLTLLVWKKA